MNADVSGKYQKLLYLLRSYSSIVLAYSGGVDSSFLLLALTEANVPYLAVTAVSPTMPSRDHDNALAIARQLGAVHRVIASSEMANEHFVSNPTDRCFHCKSDLFGHLNQLAAQEGYAVVVDGSTMDDLGDYRPGMAAKALYGVKSPLIEVGLTKQELRVLSREKGLPTWDRPASPCLSSRIPYGERIEEGALRKIEAAETTLRSLGFSEVRVRKQGETARIELPMVEMERLLYPDIRPKVVTALRALGFLYVTLDMEGFASGKMNRVIAVTEKREEEPSVASLPCAMP